MSARLWGVGVGYAPDSILVYPFRPEGVSRNRPTQYLKFRFARQLFSLGCQHFFFGCRRPPVWHGALPRVLPCPSILQASASCVNNIMSHHEIFFSLDTSPHHVVGYTHGDEPHAGIE